MEYAKTQQQKVVNSAGGEKLAPRSGPERAMAAQTGWDGTAAIDEKMWADAAAQTAKTQTSRAPARRGDNLNSQEAQQKMATEMWKRAGN